MKWIGRMAGCWRRASALASWRKRVSMPGVQAISGCSTLQARHAAPVHILPVLILRVALGLVFSYVVLVAVAWLFQERLAFPAPRAPVPDPPRVGVANGEKIELVMKDGTRLAGWYLKPVEVSGASTILHHPPQPAQPAPALLWFYGNGENIATIWPIVRDV